MKYGIRLVTYYKKGLILNQCKMVSTLKLRLKFTIIKKILIVFGIKIPEDNEYCPCLL